MNDRDGPGAQVVVVMGVSGAGKSTIARLLAERLGWIFADADDDHPAANVEKMRGGQSLDEDDRRPWLEILRARIAGWLAGGRSAVLACSALTRASREILGAGDARVRFVHLAASRDVLRARLEGRRGHFMPPGLLDEQLATLELAPGEVLEVDAEHEPEAIVDDVRRRLGLG